MKMIISISLEVSNTHAAEAVAEKVKEVIKNENNVNFNARSVASLSKDLPITPDDNDNSETKPNG